LSGGERRLLEISRALMMQPKVLLVDEPSIGLEPRYIDMVFEILSDLQHRDGKTIVLVEQNARKGLAFADIGYVLVAGRLALADKASALLNNPEVGRLFRGGWGRAGSPPPQPAPIKGAGGGEVSMPQQCLEQIVPLLLVIGAKVHEIHQLGEQLRRRVDQRVIDHLRVDLLHERLG